MWCLHHELLKAFEMHGGETAGVRWGHSCSRPVGKQKLPVSGRESPKPEAPMLLVGVP